MAVATNTCWEGYRHLCVIKHHAKHQTLVVHNFKYDLKLYYTLNSRTICGPRPNTDQPGVDKSSWLYSQKLLCKHVYTICVYCRWTVAVQLERRGLQQYYGHLRFESC